MNFRIPFWHVPKLFPLLHWFQNSFCFYSRMFPSHASNFFRLQKTFFGYKIRQDCATTVQLALLSYMSIALFRDTPLGDIRGAWCDCHLAINGQKWPKLRFFAIWPSDHVQQIYPSGTSLKRAIKCSAVLTDLMAENRFFAIFPL